MNAGRTERPTGWKAFGLGLLAGLVAALMLTAVMLLLRAWFGVATPLEMFGDRIAVFIPANRFLELMGKVGGYTPMKKLGVGGALGGQLVIGALGGWIYALLVARRGRSGLMLFLIFVLAPLAVFGAFLAPVLATSYAGLPMVPAMMATLVGLLLAFIAYERTLVWSYDFLTMRPAGRTTSGGEFTPSIGRRAFVLGGVGLLAAGGSVALLRKLYQAATFSYDGTQYKGREVTAITPNDKFYCVTKNVVDPRVHPAAWRLEIGGLVANPRRYSLDELKSLGPIEQETTLMCISNQISDGLMSNARWTGVPLPKLLAEARPHAEAKKVLLHAVDNYTDSFPFEKAMNPTTLIAYLMNGEPLPDRHGAPARVIVPGYFGEKNVKWLTRIEVAGAEAKGFYEKQGWGPDFIIPTRSRIDDPADKATLELSKLDGGMRIRGVAFAGDRGVSRVEVTMDGAKTWHEARLDYPGTKLTWALWSFDWQPGAAGNYLLSVRATDGGGQLQTQDNERPFTSGVTGFHWVGVHVA